MSARLVGSGTGAETLDSQNANSMPPCLPCLIDRLLAGIG
jgi:hypothetical protein